MIRARFECGGIMTLELSHIDPELVGKPNYDAEGFRRWFQQWALETHTRWCDCRRSPVPREITTSYM